VRTGSLVTQGGGGGSPPGVSPRTHWASFRPGNAPRRAWPGSLSDRL